MTETVIASSVLISVIILLRTLLKGRLSSRARYALWLIAAVRLMIPAGLPESPLSVMNLFSEDTAETSLEAPADKTKDHGEKAAISEETDTAAAISGDTLPEQPDNEDISRGKRLSAAETAHIIRLSVSALIMLWLTAVNAAFGAGLARSRKRLEYELPLKVYCSDRIKSPCIFGFFRPAIYVTPKAAEDKKALKLIVTHELCHFYHGDTLWAVLRYILLAVYWFDPLVWAAVILSKRDCECACDEAVIRRIGSDRRFEYGKTLIEMIPEKRDKLFGAASTSMSAESRVIKERISFIAKNAQNKLWAAVTAALTVLVTVCVSFTSAPAISAETIAEDIISVQPPAEETAAQTDETAESEAVTDVPDAPDKYIGNGLFSENIAERLGADGTIPGGYSEESFGYIDIAVPTANSSSVIGDLYLWQDGDMSLKINRNLTASVPENAEVTEGTFCERPCRLYEYSGSSYEIGIILYDFEDVRYSAVIGYSDESEAETARKILSTIHPTY